MPIQGARNKATRKSDAATPAQFHLPSATAPRDGDDRVDSPSRSPVGRQRRIRRWPPVSGSGGRGHLRWSRAWAREFGNEAGEVGPSGGGTDLLSDHRRNDGRERVATTRNPYAGRPQMSAPSGPSNDAADRLDVCIKIEEAPHTADAVPRSRRSRWCSVSCTWSSATRDPHASAQGRGAVRESAASASSGRDGVCAQVPLQPLLVQRRARNGRRSDTCPSGGRGSQLSDAIATGRASNTDRMVSLNCRTLANPAA